VKYDGDDEKIRKLPHKTAKKRLIISIVRQTWIGMVEGFLENEGR